MILHPTDVEGLGALVRRCASSAQESEELMRHPNRVLNAFFTNDLEAADAPQIVVVHNSEHVMFMVIPWEQDIASTAHPYKFPLQYDPNSGSHIPEDQQERRINFRIGDYTLNSCM